MPPQLSGAPCSPLESQVLDDFRRVCHLTSWPQVSLVTPMLVLLWRPVGVICDRGVSGRTCPAVTALAWRRARCKGPREGDVKCRHFLWCHENGAVPRWHGLLVSLNIGYFTITRPDFVSNIICCSRCNASRAWLSYQRDMDRISNMESARGSKFLGAWPRGSRMALISDWSGGRRSREVGSHLQGVPATRVGYSPRCYYSYTCFDYHLDFFSFVELRYRHNIIVNTQT